LDGKRLARRSCRVVGESRTGKTVNCNTYRLKSKVVQIPGQPPTIPVVYWHSPEELSVSGLFVGLLQLTTKLPKLEFQIYGKDCLKFCVVAKLK
jgi:hypothetical protein